MQSKSNIAEQYVQNVTMSVVCATLSILCTTANSAYNSVHQELQNFDIPNRNIQFNIMLVVP